MDQVANKSYSNPSNQNKWDLILRAKKRWFEIDLKSVFKYRDLIFLFVKRDFVAQYKQTILGPLWMFIQPFLTVLLFSIIFSGLARLSTSDVPPLLFYLSAYVPWVYLSECITKNSSIFKANSAIFGKVYFPRLVIPFSIIISNIFRFFIQLFLFFIVYFYFASFKTGFSINAHALFLPLLVLLIAIIGLSIGLIISSLTIKYRDLSLMVTFFIQFLMYGSSVIFAYNSLGEGIEQILVYNPIVWINEAFRFALLGVGTWSWLGLLYSTGCAVFLLFIALFLFTRVDNNFIDTI